MTPTEGFDPLRHTAACAAVLLASLLVASTANAQSYQFVVEGPSADVNAMLRAGVIECVRGGIGADPVETHSISAADDDGALVAHVGSAATDALIVARARAADGDRLAIQVSIVTTVVRRDHAFSTRASAETVTRDLCAGSLGQQRSLSPGVASDPAGGGASAGDREGRARASVSAELRFFTRKVARVRTTALPLVVSGAAPISRSSTLGMTLGTTFYRRSGDQHFVLGNQSDSVVAFANPVLEFRNTRRAGSATWATGASVALPLASGSDESRGALYRRDGLRRANAATAGMELPLWYPGAATLSVPVSIGGTGPQGSWSVGATLDSFYLLERRHDGYVYQDSGFALAARLRAGGGLTAGPVVLGTRLGVLIAMVDDADALMGTDRAQASFEWYLGVPLGSSTLDISLATPIDEPWGFAFSDEGLWSLGIGFHWDSGP